MATRAQLVDALLELPAAERAEAARALLESLDAPPANDSVDVHEAWRSEISRRVEEIDAGEVALVDGPTAMAELRRRAQARLDRDRR